VSLLDLTACPEDRTPLAPEGEELVCTRGHRFPFPDGIPVLLSESIAPTHPVFAKSLADARSGAPEEPGPPEGELEPFVQDGIAAQCGHLYRHLVGRLPRYPIPELRLPPGEGRLFLELGSSWGRWSIAAARRGYVPVGVDPSLEAVRAGRRIARRLGVEAHYLVGDARRLPFPDRTFDAGFSYSVLQHFAKENVRLALRELRRVLKPGATSLVQMGNALGARSAVARARERIRPGPAEDFRVRYWTPWELERVFEEELGPSRLEVDGFFSLNAQAADLDLMPRRLRAVIHASDAARAAAARVPPLRLAADSLYVRSTIRSDY
jgi:SAM-dependent methyltransferase/uncharacterized protein YbaR (Trm112 family)